MNASFGLAKSKVALLLLVGMAAVCPWTSPAAEPPRTTDRAALIADRLQQARAAVAANRLSTPSGDNAVAYAQQVLELDPNNAQAEQILRDVVARYDSLSAAVLARGEAQRQRALERAETFETRAERVVEQYKLPEEDLKPLASRLAAARAGPRSEGAALIEEVVARYVQLGEAAVARGEMDEARRHQSEAQAVALQYGVGDGDVQALARRIQAEAPLASERRWRQVLAYPETQLVAEVMTYHVVLGEQALSEGRLRQARWHHDHAEAFATRYRLSDDGLVSLNRRLVRYEAGYRPYRIYGTF